MNCMKCGREFNDDQAFCPECLEKMAQNPVKPDTIINLPNRTDPALRKAASRKRTRTPEEQLLRLKKINNRLIIGLCLMTIVATILAFLSIDFFRQLDVQRFLGKNYSTVETVD